jgi:hypothetical protein
LIWAATKKITVAALPLHKDTFFGWQSRTNVEKCSYYETFELERSSYFFIWSLKNKKLQVRHRCHCTKVFYSGGGLRTTVGNCFYYETFELERSSHFLIWSATKMQGLFLSVRLQLSLYWVKNNISYLSTHFSGQNIRNTPKTPI